MCNARSRPSTIRATRMFARAFSAAMLAGLAGACLADEKLPLDRKPDEEVIQRRPGPSEPLQYIPPPIDPRQVAPPTPSARREILPVPDRWRIMRSLGVDGPWYDPYNPNVLKADFPIAQ